MNFRTAIEDLGRPMDWREAVLSIRDERGPGASRWIAEQFRVSQRTAQRWLKGEQAPSTKGGRRAAVQAAAIRRRVASRALRHAQFVSVGRVGVAIKSTGVPDGTRPVSTLDVDEQLAAELAQVADALDAGDWDGAEGALSGALLGAYAEAQGDNRDAARTALDITDYRNGIEVG